MDETYSRLNSIIRNIVSTSTFNDKDIEEAAENLYAYYKAGNDNLYSETYRWLSRSNEGDFEYLILRLNSVEIKISQKYPDILKKYKKLKDYVLLEALRASDLADIRKITKDAKKQVLDVKKMQEEFEESRKVSHTQSITVLSIFTGIAMAFFGGFSLLGSAFERLGQPGVSFLELLILVLVVGLILFNTVYLLLFCASRINNHPLINPDHQDCSKCTREKACKKRILKYINFIWKYPLPSWINICLLVIIVALFIIAVFHDGLILWHF